MAKIYDLNVRVNQEVRIVKDKLNYIPQYWGLVTPNEKEDGTQEPPYYTWKDQGYYMKLSQAFTKVLDDKVGQSQAKDLKSVLVAYGEALEVIKGVSKDIEKE